MANEFIAKKGLGIGNLVSTLLKVNASGIVVAATAGTDYQAPITNPTTGTGTTNYVTKWTGTSTLGNSTIFDNGTNVGIGTTSPTDGKLQVAGNTQLGNTIAQTYFGVGAAATKVTSNGSWAIGVDAADGSTERLRITSSGNVGIGTTSPAYPLSIENSSEYQIGYKRLVGTSKQWAFGADNTSTYFRNITDAITAYTITNTGNVGIGTNSPIYSLDVHSNQGAYTSRFYQPSTATNTYNSVLWSGANSSVIGYVTTGGSTVANSALQNNFGIGTQNSYPLVLLTNDTERMRITSTGNVGIGTTSPSEKFEVNGAIKTSSLLVIGSNFYSGIGSQISGSFGVNDYVAGNYSATGNMIMVTNAAECMRITSTGNVGIGTTNPTSKFAIQVANSATNISSLDITNAVNASFNVSLRTGVTEITAGGDGNMAFSNSTERMRITSTGNVGIGTASPAVKLDVNGSSRFSGFDLNYYKENVLAIGNGTNNPKIGLASTNGYRWNTRIRDVGGDGEYVIRYEEGSLDALVINRSGNVGIGTTSPAYKLDVSKTANDSQPTFRVQGNTFEDSLVYFVNTAVGTGGTGAGGITIQYTISANNNTDSNFINCNDAVDLRFIVWNNGGIGNFQSNDVDLSDERTKNSITNLESYWDKIKNIEIVKYKYNDQSHDDYNIGVIAQQVEEIAPEFIDNNSWKIKDTEDYYKTVYNKDLQFAAIKVLQEAMIKIEKLEQELEILKNK